MTDKFKEESFTEVGKLQRAAKILIFIGSVFLVCAALLFIFKTTSIRLSSSINTDIFGNFGDLIGGIVGAIWSLAGIFLFYAALRLQREDLILQREELKKSREIAEEQGKTFRIQRFENTFFQLRRGKGN